MIRKILLYILLILVMTSCTRYAYFQNPLHSHSNFYRTIPMKSDSIPVAMYGGGSFSAGVANENIRDGILLLQGNIHRSHQFGIFQAYYGLSGSSGLYNIGTVSGLEPDNNLHMNSTIINSRQGSKYAGSIGGFAAMNVVRSSPLSEWRIIGAELSYHHEFGAYFRFRKNLPDSAANLNENYRQHVYISLNTDMVWRTRQGSMGYKVAFVINPRRLTYFDLVGTPSPYTPLYISQTFHIENANINYYLQLNLGGRAASIQVGATRQLKN